MAFNLKSDPTILSIKLTDIGRQQLAAGNLNFATFQIGDSEIDYNFVNNTGINPNNLSILQATDNEPQILSYIPQILSGSSTIPITNTVVVPLILENTTQTRGFFNILSGGTTVFTTTPQFCKQPDMMVRIKNLNGISPQTLNLYKAPTYGLNTIEPQVGDYLLIKWVNPLNNFNTTGYTVNINKPTAYLWYKIQAILSGTTLAANNLVVTIDRNLPNYNGYNTNLVAGAMCYNNSLPLSGSSPTNFIQNALFSYFTNQQTAVDFPWWNLSIVFTEDIAGIRNTNKSFGYYNSAQYGGFVSYYQNQQAIIKKLGLIHYSNPSPANTYAESLFENTPSIYIPTVMWNYNTGDTMGLTLSAIGNEQSLPVSNIIYYDLADPYGNIVGKVLNDIKMFVIEDQELLFALSYKSNRNWTLPYPNVNILTNLFNGCPACVLSATVTGVNPVDYGLDGSINITSLIKGNNTSPVFLQANLQGNPSPILFTQITGTTYTVNNLTANYPIGTTYTITLYDTSSPNCYVNYNITLTSPPPP